MIHRTRLRTAAFLALLPWASSVAKASDARAPKRVVIIPWEGPDSVLRPKNKAILAGWFAEHGLVEGRDFLFEYEASASSPAAFHPRAKDLVASAPAVIVLSNELVMELKPLTSTIPLVFYGFPGDPVRAGLVQSLRHPGGNVTGTADFSFGICAKTWDLLRELRTGMKRMGALFDEGYNQSPEILELTREAQVATARRLGVARVEIVLPRDASLSNVERAIRAARIDAADVALSDEKGVTWAEPLKGLLEKARIPATWDHGEHVKRGGLLAMEPSGGGVEMVREAILIAARIVKGTSPAEIPVYEPKNWLISINLRTARAMGIEVPPGILLRAGYVVR